MSNRRFRRGQLRLMQTLRIKNMYSRFSEVGMMWYNKTQKEGQALYEKNRKATEDSIFEQLQAIEDSKKANFLSIGYSEAKVELLLEAWRIGAVKNKETYREDKKEAQRLLREAAAMK